MIDMNNKHLKIWIWVQNSRIFKAISNRETGTLAVYDEEDNIILRRTGLSPQQIKTFELIFTALSLKHIDDHKEPFTYL